MTPIAEILGPKGLLADQVEGFQFREQQLAMAEEVMATLSDGEVLVAEAGTGTGKTFAYLVPALLSGRKVLVATGTKALQDQLYLRDLPKVRELLGSSAKISQLKGRANYLCRYRVEVAVQDKLSQRPDIQHRLTQVWQWAGQTKRGDIAELTRIPEDSPVWPLVTSTTDNCLGQDCPSWQDCHLVEARRKAQEADLVVINHHLLCADFALKDDGFGELLPNADAFIIDEAHQLPEVAGQFFGDSLSTRQLQELVRDTEMADRLEAGDSPELKQRLAALDKAVKELRLAFGGEMRRGAWQEVANSADMRQALDDTREWLAALAGALKQLEGRGKELDSCQERAKKLGELLNKVAGTAVDNAQVRWFEVYRSSLRLASTPLDVAELFSHQMASREAAWVFTSATLAVGASFQHFQDRLGLAEARTGLWDSPFDYANQALWYVPRGLPEPRDHGYTRAVLDEILPILEASAGRAFLLFTSHRALREAATLLANRTEHELLVQGEAPKNELLKQFVEHGNAVLLGTASFWEGVDVRGEALSLVVIDKLPFASPGDPVLQARLDALRAKGGNPFMDYQVPQAAIALKQGAGRLIRDTNDRGVLVICDRRLLKRGYGHIFLDSMPAFARTRERDDVIRFFQPSQKDPQEAPA